MWWVGLLGGLVGGLIGLGGGFLADRRAQRNARIDRVRSLMADVLTYSTMIRDAVMEYRARRARVPIATQTVPDLSRMTGYELELIRSGAELSWLLSRSPSLMEQNESLARKATALIHNWSAKNEAVEVFDADLHAHIRQFGREAADLLRLTNRQIARRLHA